jgi:hypothetical protein
MARQAEHVTTLEEQLEHIVTSLDDKVMKLAGSLLKSALAELPPPKDPVTLANAVINQAGELVLAMSDGTTKAVGRVVGRDADMNLLQKQISDEIAAIPKPKDGRDGIGFDDLAPEFDEQGRLYIKFGLGDVEKRFRVPCLLDRGVYKSGETYLAGDSVSYGGSTWIAQRDNPPGKPETGEPKHTGWRLAVQRGRDGKAGPPGPRGEHVVVKA